MILKLRAALEYPTFPVGRQFARVVCDHFLATSAYDAAQVFVGRSASSGTILDRSSDPANPALGTVSCSPCGHAKGDDVSLEHADMSSFSRWAATVYSVTSDQGIEIGFCDCPDVVPVFLDSRLVRALQSSPWHLASVPDLCTLTQFFACHARTLAGCRDVVKDDNLYALNLHSTATPTTMLKLR